MNFEDLYNKIEKYRYNAGDKIIYNWGNGQIVLEIVEKEKYYDGECFYNVKKRKIDENNNSFEFFAGVRSESYIRKKELNGRMCDSYEI